MTAQPCLSLRLYIAGNTPNSMLAMSNLKRLLSGENHELDVVDVMLEPFRALDDGILVTPTLVRLTPAPEVRIIGSLDLQNPVRQALGLVAASA